MTTFNIKNMVCRHCVAAVREALEKLGLEVTDARLGSVTVDGPEPDDARLAEIDTALAGLGFERITDTAALLVEKVKQAVLHHVRDEHECRLNLSACIERRTGMNYDRLSRVFSATEGRTIEKYHIDQKIERVKELLGYGELTLAEIAWRTGFSSAAHLSRRFKEATGMTPTQYLRSGAARRDISEA